jgi:hypothetical protein
MKPERATSNELSSQTTRRATLSRGSSVDPEVLYNNLGVHKQGGN